MAFACYFLGLLMLSDVTYDSESSVIETQKEKRSCYLSYRSKIPTHTRRNQGPEKREQVSGRRKTGAQPLFASVAIITVGIPFSLVVYELLLSITLEQ